MWADCHLTFLFCPTCTLYAFSLISYSCFPFSLLYLSFVISIVCIFCLVFFSFYFSVPFSFSCSPSGLVVLTLAFYLKLVSIWFLLFNLPFFRSFFFSFPPCFSHPFLSDLSQSLPLFLPPSHTLFPTAKPVR